MTHRRYQKIAIHSAKKEENINILDLFRVNGLTPGPILQSAHDNTKKGVSR